MTGEALVGAIPLDLDPSERARRKRQGSALVLVNLVEGTATQVGGYFEHSAWEPVWTSDDSWVFFGAPFEDAMYGVSTQSPKPDLQPVTGAWRHTAMPLLHLESPT